MKRPTYLKTMLAANAGAIAAGAAGSAHPIQLHVDLTVDPANEKEMLKNFETVFRPAASKQPGYIDVKMLRLRSAVQGQAPAGVHYRFSLRFQNEELRQSADAYDALGMMQAREAQWVRAESSFRRAVGMAPRDAL